MILLGFGAGIAFNPVLLAAMSDVEPEEAGLASGIVNTAFMMGGALGLAVLASVAARAPPPARRRQPSPGGARGRLPGRVRRRRRVRRAGRRPEARGCSAPARLPPPATGPGEHAGAPSRKPALADA